MSRLPACGELSQLVGDGTQVLGVSAARLRERMGELADWQGRFTALAEYPRQGVQATEGRDGGVRRKWRKAGAGWPGTAGPARWTGSPPMSP